MLVNVVATAPNSDGSATDLDLMMVSVTAVSLPGTPEGKCHEARQALLQAVCEHLLPRPAAAGTPFGSLRHFEDFIVLPS